VRERERERERKSFSSEEMNFIRKINLFMILLCTIAKVVNGMTLRAHPSSLEMERVRSIRSARLLDIKEICAPGMKWIEGRCRKVATFR
jgi:hypothetical protein